LGAWKVPWMFQCLSVLCLYCLFLGFYVFNGWKKECCFVESVGGIDEDPPSIAPTQMWFPSFLNVENVHLQFSNILNVDVS
jgi:hypothetical protein